MKGRDKRNAFGFGQSVSDEAAYERAMGMDEIKLHIVELLVESVIEMRQA
jgi:hypothetical protein